MALSEILLVNFGRKTYENSPLNEDTIAWIIKEQVEVIIYNMLLNQQQENNRELRTVAVMLSWAVYGASEEWKRKYREVDPKTFIKKSRAPAYILHSDLIGQLYCTLKNNAMHYGKTLDNQAFLSLCNA